ncbi:uncharacterized protein LOC104420880 isoform X4 [Eucalyptus grandis]|uniref:uncharacterized protein LOC104420880 isoform X4 n=1 Tax=Eucalyptus grandis TaxID=71139 RepID=UPI0008A0B070|nr:uncharacterized protein LOC104420880 isoform X4 [Eucalyptus grandis]
MVAVGLAAMGGTKSGSGRMGASWFATFLWTAGRKNSGFPSRDLDLLGIFICQGTTIQGNLEDLLLWSLWTLMMLLMLNTIWMDKILRGGKYLLLLLQRVGRGQRTCVEELEGNLQGMEEDLIMDVLVHAHDLLVAHQLLGVGIAPGHTLLCQESVGFLLYHLVEGMLMTTPDRLEPLHRSAKDGMAENPGTSQGKHMIGGVHLQLLTHQDHLLGRDQGLQNHRPADEEICSSRSCSSRCVVPYLNSSIFFCVSELKRMLFA